MFVDCVSVKVCTMQPFPLTSPYGGDGGRKRMRQWSGGLQRRSRLSRPLAPSSLSEIDSRACTAFGLCCVCLAGFFRT